LSTISQSPLPHAVESPTPGNTGTQAADNAVIGRGGLARNVESSSWGYIATIVVIGLAAIVSFVGNIRHLMVPVDDDLLQVPDED
jgi:hypothetical protein